MSASLSSAAGDAPGRRVIFIDVVSDTWVLSGVLILLWMTTPVPPSHVVFGANVTACCIADEYYLRIWPWCYISKLRLESALATAETCFPHLTFDVRWRPYELNPNLPKGKGHDKMEYYNSKFGPAMVQSMIPRMKEVAHGIRWKCREHFGQSCAYRHRLKSLFHWWTNRSTLCASSLIFPPSSFVSALDMEGSWGENKW
jgi:hypothetical protein